MTTELDMLCEIWDVVKPHLDKHSQSEVCAGLIEIFDSYNMTDGFENELDIDPKLRKEILEYFNEDETE